MAYDIGPRIGVEGEKEFRNTIEQINRTMKTLGTEMAVVTSAYAKNDKSVENLSAQNQVLTKKIEEQSKKLEEQKKFVAEHAEELAKDEKAAAGWQQAINRSTADLNKMERQLRENNEALRDLDFKKAFQGADDLIDTLEDIAREAEDAGEAFAGLDGNAIKPKKSFTALKVAAGNLLSSGVQALASGVKDAATAFLNLDKTTEEYRIAQGKLKTAFEAAGKSTESAKETYTEFYKILGDTDTAAEASQLLAKLAEDEEDLSEWTEIAAGVYGTFGDALPINGLIEAANETVKTGKVTGTLADALNWAGISEEEFNKQLAEASDESERNQLLMDTLSGVYDEAGDAFYRNNEEIVKARENQAKLDEITGRLGESVSHVKNALVEKFGPALADIGEKVADWIDNIDTEELSQKFDDAWKSITDTWNGAADYFRNVGRQISYQFGIGLNEARNVKYGGFGSSGKGGSFGGSSNSSVDSDAIAAAVQRGLSGVSVNMNGRRVGNMVTTQQGRDARAAGGYAALPV